jgi:long-chain fatty acid transport protein
VAVVVLLAAPAARANTMETFGFGPRGTSMAGALTANAADYTAVFYNPAMLVLRKEVNFGFAFAWFRTTSTVEPIDRAKELDCTYCQPPDAVGYSVGLLFPLGGKVQNRVAFGLGVYLPSQRLLRVQASDTKRPFWYLYNNSPERIVIYMGGGVRITDNLTVGFGVQALADLVGQGASMKVDLFSKQVEFREIDSHLSTRMGPVAGIYFTPVEGFRLGLAYRHEMALLLQIPAKVDLEGIGVLAFTVQGITHFSPHTVVLGTSWDVTPELTLSADLQWANWSAAPSPYVSLNIDLSGDTLKALGLDEALDIAPPEQKPGFSDTLGGKVGLEYRVSERFAARAGAFYRPTPVPKQNVAGTNILDASAIGVAGGIGFSFDDPLEVFQSPVHMDLAVQGTFLLPREAEKDLTDSVPSYRYSARVFGLTGAIRYDF